VYFYNIGSKRTHHPCEKYEAMLKPLIETHSNPGSVVLDPFFGGGNSSLVCQELRRSYIGFEINPEWYTKAKKMLQAQIANDSNQQK
jgi:site-specific DNA-methyltransferase (adenine-specific)